jgi:hypothetical protein
MTIKDAQAWIPLLEQRSGRLVLAVDVDGSVRREASFWDLADILPTAVDVWHTTLPSGAPLGTLSPDAYLDRWLAHRPHPDRPVEAVLGYCAGSLYACALADRLQAGQPRPEVVLFNPGIPDQNTLRRDFTGMMSAMPGLPEATRETLLDLQNARQWGDFESAAEHCLGSYREACSIMADQLGLEADLSDQMVDIFASYLGYLGAARALARSSTWRTATSIVSSDHAQPPFTDDQLPVPVSRQELLGDPDVISQLHGRLERHWRQASLR